MSFNPATGQKMNYMGSLRRTMQFAWWGEAAALQFGQPPTLLNGEFITQVNPTNTGVISLLGADANGQPVTPLQTGITITSAQILTLNTAPVTIIPAPAAGQAIALNNLVIEMIRTATAYTGGGTVGPVYAGITGTYLTNQMAAADVTTAGAATVPRLLVPLDTAGGVLLAAATAVQLFAATANFAAGTGTMKVYAQYSIVTL